MVAWVVGQAPLSIGLAASCVQRSYRAGSKILDLGSEFRGQLGILVEAVGTLPILNVIQYLEPVRYLVVAE